MVVQGRVVNMNSQEANVSAGLVLLNSTVPSDLVDFPYLDPQPNDAYLAQVINQLTLTRFVVWKILVPVVVGFGLIGNTVNIVVLTRRSMRSSTNVYLTALAICDVLYLIFGFSLGLKHLEGIRDLVSYKKYRKPFGYPLVDTFSNTGVWLTLTFTIERYIGVCHPMKGKVLCTPQRARYIVITVCICTFILTFPEFFALKAVTILGPYNDTRVIYEPILEDFPSYQWGFRYLHQVLFTLGPLLLLLIFNSLLMRAVLKAAKKRRSMSKVAMVQNDKQDRHHREQQKITIMLIMVVIVFLLCQLPQAIINLYTTYLRVTGRLTDTLRYRLVLTANVCNLLVMLNSSTNFILYSAFSLKFRRTFKRVFCKCLVKKVPPEHLMSDVYSNDGSKTNLILRAPHVNMSNVYRSPRGARPSQMTTSVNQTANKTRTKNGYLEVNQANHNISAV